MRLGGSSLCRSLANWRETVGRRLLSVDYTPSDPDDFAASFAFAPSPLRGARMLLSPGVTFRDEALAREGEGSILLVAARQGTVAIRSKQRETTLRRGQATLLDLSQPGTIGAKEMFALDVFILPLQDLGPDLGAVEPR